MPTRAAFVACMVLLALVATARVRADALRQVERRTSPAPRRGPDRPPPRDAPRRRAPMRSADDDRLAPAPRGRSFDGRDPECGHAHQDPCPGDSMLRMLVQYTLGAPWSYPRLFDRPELLGYAARPHASRAGLLRLAPGTVPAEDQAGVREVAIAIDLESGYMLEGVVPVLTAMRLALPYRLELDARMGMLLDVEERPVDSAASATMHLGYRFAQGERFDFRFGLGARLFSLDRVRAGVDLLYTVDAYLPRRLVLRLELHAGSLGHAFAGEARATLGVQLGPVEIYAGYDHTAFIREGRSRLGGPLLGARAWF